jgi:cold shock protein
MSSATVKSFNATKGCGFIQPDDGDGKAASVHIKAVQKAGFNGLVEGCKIAFRRRARSKDRSICRGR